MGIMYHVMCRAENFLRIRGIGRPQYRSCESPRSVEILLDHIGGGWGVGDFIFHDKLL